MSTKNRTAVLRNLLAFYNLSAGPNATVRSEKVEGGTRVRAVSTSRLTNRAQREAAAVRAVKNTFGAEVVAAEFVDVNRNRNLRVQFAG